MKKAKNIYKNVDRSLVCGFWQAKLAYNQIIRTYEKNKKNKKIKKNKKNGKKRKNEKKKEKKEK